MEKHTVGLYPCEEGAQFGADRKICSVARSVVNQVNECVCVAVAYTAVAGIPAVLVTFGIAVARNMPEAATFNSILGRLLPKRG